MGILTRKPCRLVRATGISDTTLQTWRKKALSRGIPVPLNG